MIIGTIDIATTWNASTSFVPFTGGMQDAHDYAYGGRSNRGIFATTAWIQGVWEYQIYESDMKTALSKKNDQRAYIARKRLYGGASLDGRILEEMNGMGSGPELAISNAFSPGTMIGCKVRKIKALKASPNRSGVQVSNRLVKGNKLIFRYVAQGELVRPR